MSRTWPFLPLFLPFAFILPFQFLFTSFINFTFTFSPFYFYLFSYLPPSSISRPPRPYVLIIYSFGFKTEWYVGSGSAQKMVRTHNTGDKLVILKCSVTKYLQNKKQVLQYVNVPGLRGDPPARIFSQQPEQNSVINVSVMSTLLCHEDKKGKKACYVS